ncbi:histone deacetylase HDT1-like [Fagus crenata]
MVKPVAYGRSAFLRFLSFVSLTFCCLAIATDEHDHDHECESESESDDDEESLDLPPLNMPENGKAAPKVVAKSVAAKSSEKQVKVVEPKKDEEDDETSDEDDDDSDEDIDDLEDMSDDDLLGESDDEPEETPKKAESGKKRPSESATKTPVPTKKAKAATPQKTDGKKGVHTATPHPSKKAGKTPANSGEQSKPQTPKSAGGSFPCKSCSKSWSSVSHKGQAW